MTDDVPAALADITEDLDAAAHRLDEVAEQLGRGERDDPGTEAAGVVEAVDAQVVVDSTDDPGTSGSWGEPAGTPRDQPGPLPQPQHRSTSDFFANNANKRLNPGAIMRLADVARRDPRVVEELETSIQAAVYSFDANEVLHTAELLQRVKDESRSLELLRHELFTAGRALPSRFWTH
ncbi:hypothetical protein [Kitasatospora phosalacinea]|nr:hypothetical protein [Kitasatospora phosalacinea]